MSSSALPSNGPQLDRKRSRQVLIVYALAEQNFTCGYLVPALGELEHGHPLARSLSSAELSRLAVLDLEEEIRASRAVVLVLSPAFLADPWLRLSDVLASHVAVASGQCVIPVRYQDCELPLHLEAAVSLDFRRSHCPDDSSSWDKEVQQLRVHLDQPAPLQPTLPCPYPGMRPFAISDAAYFHGRAAEVDAILDHIAGGDRELFVLGPSGCGKSSLLAAGAVPKLLGRASPTRPLLLRTVRPGATPSRRLVEALYGHPQQATAAISGLAVTAAALEVLWMTHPQATLVVIIDQLEELFAQASAAQQKAFAASVRALRGDARITVMYTLRADFFAELLQSELWAESSKAVFTLSPLRDRELRETVERPARELEVYFEAGLLERLASDAADQPGALPLLQETLVHLWVRRRQRLLTLADYQAMGGEGRSGLCTVLAARADQVMSDLSSAQAIIARRVLLRLVAFGEGRPHTRRCQTRGSLRASEPASELDAVLDTLAGSRLVVMDRSERINKQGNGGQDGDRVDLCHDALIIAWPAFSSWVATRQADEQQRRRIQNNADDWVARGRGSSGTLDEAELAIARAWRTTDAAGELGESAEVTALIAASVHAITARRRQRRRQLAILFVGLTLAAAVAFVMALRARVSSRAAQSSSRAAQSALARSEQLLAGQFEDEGRRLVVAGEPVQAVPYLLAARERGGDGVTLRMLFRAATRAQVVSGLPTFRRVTWVDVSGDGAKIITASLGADARVWDASTGAPLTPPMLHERPVVKALLNRDGTRALTLDEGDAARLWDLSVLPPRATALRHDARVLDAAFSPDGAFAITGSADQTARVWNARSGQPVSAPLRHDGKVFGAMLSPDGALAVTFTGDQPVAQVWDVARGQPRVPPLQHGSLLTSASFSPDGARIVTGSIDKTARLWSATTGQPVTPPLPHDGEVQSAAFRPDGAAIVTASADHRARVWSATTGQLLSPVMEHPCLVVYAAQFARDGNHVITGCSDNRPRVWDVTVPNPSATVLESESGASFAVSLANRARLVVAHGDNRARIWDYRVDRATSMIKAGDGGRDAIYRPDGLQLATVSESAGVQLWHASGALESTLPRRTRRFAISRLVYSRDGRRLASIALGQQVEVWDLTSHRRLAAPDEPGALASGSTLPPKGIASASFSPDGLRIATAAIATGARIWDVETGRAVTPPLLHAARVLSIRFSPDGRRVITASQDGTARVWNAETGQPIGDPMRHLARSHVMAASYSPDSTRIVTACSDGTARVWDAATHLLRFRLDHSVSVVDAVFSSDGQKILTSSTDHTARLWSAHTGVMLVPALQHDDWVNEAAFSSDGAMIVTASGNEVRVWAAATGQPLTPPLRHQKTVRGASFSPDDQQLLTITRGDEARIWDLASDQHTLEHWRRVAALTSFPTLRRLLLGR